MIHLQEGEHIDIKARKHWFILFGESFGVLIIYLLPFLAWKFLSEGILSSLDTSATASLSVVDPTILTFLGSAWTLFAWAWFFHIWTNYYLDVWVVTENRIVNIDQKGLFHREVSTLRTERIQDVTVEVAGIIATVLNFGDVHVQTAGEHPEFVIKGISRPEWVKRKILTHIDKKTESGHAI